MSTRRFKTTLQLDFKRVKTHLVPRNIVLIKLEYGMSFLCINSRSIMTNSKTVSIPTDHNSYFKVRSLQEESFQSELCPCYWSMKNNSITTPAKPVFKTILPNVRFVVHKTSAPLLCFVVIAGLLSRVAGNEITKIEKFMSSRRTH